MTITLPPDIEEALAREAHEQGITPEALVVQMLRSHISQIAPSQSAAPKAEDDWEAMILAMGRDCGVSLSHDAVSSDGLYD
ncbi:MAG: CopG family transcriptional regulator [Anaerolineae bacterium]